MKKKRNIISVLTLGLFVAYLGISVFIGFASDFTSSNLRDTRHISVSKHNTPIDDLSQQFSENNETENDDDVEIGAVKLPFLLSFLQLEIKGAPTQVSTQPLAEKPSNPIYLSVHNFRI